MQIENYKLSSKQISDLELYSRSVLGEEYYKMVGRFYDSIVQSRAQYRVVLTRKCFNLLNIYHWCRKKTHPDDNTEFSSLFYSDNTLIAKIPDIAMDYILFNKIPDITIISDILIHGRSVNALIDDFIKKLTDYLQLNGIDMTFEEVKNDVLCFLKIKIMVQNDKPLLMNRQYIQHIELLDGTGSVWEAVKWHDLSLKISRLISENVFSNTSYALSMFEVDEKDIAERVGNLGFVRSEWQRRGTRDVWVKPLYHHDGSITALYTIRLNQNSIDNKYSAVPFVIMSDFDLSASDVIYEKLGLIKQGTLGFSKLIPVILSYDLLLLILDGYNGTVKIDKDKIFSGAGNGTNFRFEFMDMVKRTKPFLSWEELNKLILDATANSAPLMNADTGGSLSVDELIAAEGEQLEKEAYLEYSCQKQKECKVCHKPLNVLFSMVDTSSEEKLAESVGDILRLTDTGSLALSSQQSENENEIISCVYRAGEQSQFIHPKKYMEQLPVLCEIERDCMGNIDDMLKRVRAMYGENEILCSALCDYIITLYSSGQLLSDWDINYYSWVETDFEKYPELKNRSKHDRIELQMILNSIQRMDAIKQYHNLYPDTH
jgi:hypothetical protein